MKNIILTTFIIGNKDIDLGNIPKEVEILPYTTDEEIEKAQGKYISFIDSQDSISKDYFTTILNEIKKQDFDICYISYEINYNYKRKPKLRFPNEGIHNIVPIYNPYIWNYVFTKESIYKFRDFTIQLEDLTKQRYIPKPIYFHNQNSIPTKVLNMPTKRPTIFYENIVYVENFCNITFNGYITWLLEIGKAFPEYNITIIYTEINEVPLKDFSKYFKCIKYNPNINYTCNKLITTYSTYFFPTNIFCLEENSVFIHGIIADFENAAIRTDDIYDRYIAVCKHAAKKAEGYMPSDNIEYIYNPYTHAKANIKPHLRLISATRNSPEKGIERIKKFAAILDEENIPYTWQVFTNVLEPNQGGLIFREGVSNVKDFIADSDYLLQLSDSEALSYSALEALCSSTKIIITPLPAIQELQLEEGVNSFIIPFEYFDDDNKDLLRKKVLEIYDKKDVKFKFHYNKSKFCDYENIFNK